MDDDKSDTASIDVQIKGQDSRIPSGGKPKTYQFTAPQTFIGVVQNLFLLLPHVFPSSTSSSSRLSQAFLSPSFPNENQYRSQHGNQDPFLSPSSALSLGSATTASGEGVSESSLRPTTEDGKILLEILHGMRTGSTGGLERERVEEWCGAIFNTGGILGRGGDGDGSVR
jgi:hypothetical protein